MLFMFFGLSPKNKNNLIIFGQVASDSADSLKQIFKFIYFKI